MKGMKKLLSILMVLTLVLSLSATAFAATVTVEQDPGHAYKAYQIFTGTSQNADGSIGNLTWGDGIEIDAFVNALTTAGYVKDVTEPFNTPEVAQKVAAALSELGSNSDALKEVARIASDNVKGDGTELTDGGSDLPIGYYVIVDTTSVEGKDEVQNEVVLQVSGDVNVQFKTEKPSSDKKVKDVNDSQANSESAWQDSADHDIGDTIHYQLHAHLPKDVSAYETYYLQFVDTLSKGLTFDKTVKVYIGDKDLTSYFTCSGAGAIPTEDTEHAGKYPDGTQVTWTCDDLIDAIIKAGGKASDLNSADVYVEYDATLNADAVIGDKGNPNEMHIVYSNTPDGEGHGQNTDDKVTVFTFELVIDKVDGDGNPLEGAGFTLYKKGVDGEYVEYENLKVNGQKMVTENDGKWTVSFEGLDDGDYKIVETTVPAGYNKADDIEFTVTASHDENSPDPKLTNVTSSDPVKMTEVTGVFETTVKNQKGATLPETGGIGTTIFYIAGAILVAGAVIILVTKKRVSGAEK